MYVGGMMRWYCIVGLYKVVGRYRFGASFSLHISISSRCLTDIVSTARVCTRSSEVGEQLYKPLITHLLNRL